MALTSISALHSSPAANKLRTSGFGPNGLGIWSSWQGNSGDRSPPGIVPHHKCRVVLYTALLDGDLDVWSVYIKSFPGGHLQMDSGRTSLEARRSGAYCIHILINEVDIKANDG